MRRLPAVFGSRWIIDGQMELWLSVWLQYCAGKKFPVHKEQKMPPSLLAQEPYDPLQRSYCSFKPAFMHQTNSPWWSTSVSPGTGLILQSQSCNFPKNAWNFPLYATHVWQVLALMSEYLHLPGEVLFPHTCYLFELPKPPA